jgi:hypothetical protein
MPNNERILAEDNGRLRAECRELENKTNNLKEELSNVKNKIWIKNGGIVLSVLLSFSSRKPRHLCRG